MTFQKGKIPWNKGKKFPQMSEIMKKAYKEGQKRGFQKGHTINLGKKRPNCSGKNNWNWKGGKRVSTNEYIYLLRPKHPFCDGMGYVKRCRIVMEKELGRYISPEEVIHHINKIRTDDRIENLKLFKNKSEHQKSHHPKGIKFGN